MKSKVCKHILHTPWKNQGIYISDKVFEYMTRRSHIFLQKDNFFWPKKKKKMSESQ